MMPPGRQGAAESIDRGIEPENRKGERMETLTAQIWGLMTLYGLKVLAALVILVVGRWVARAVRQLTGRLMEKAGMDPIIVNFVGNLVNIGILLFFIIAALGQLGIQTTAFIAVLGAAGLAVGLALQGSLSNFAAGFLMILFRPFKVGDYIEGAGTAGIVEEIQIFNTRLRTPDNKLVIVPNSKLTDDNIVNYATTGTRRVDMVFGIGYGDDIDKARGILIDIISADERVLKDPAPQISVSELAESSVNFVVRPWVKSNDYWNVFFETTEKVKKAFDAQNVNIPFPQHDVHVYEHKN
jgi:small conductance mechanosensitive channel